MADWRKTIGNGSGSLRNVPFLIIDEASLSGGHRVVRHEFPLRAEGETVNMGRLMRSHSFAAVVHGDDYIEQKNALIDAIEDETPCELVHPYWGRIWVQVETYNCRESTRDGGMATFNITFTPAQSKTYPTAAVNGMAELAELQAGVIDSLLADFSKSWESIQGLQAQLIAAEEAAESAVNTLSGSIRSIAGATGLSGLLGKALSLQGAISNLISSPGALAGELVGLIQGLSSIGSISAGSRALRKTIVSTGTIDTRSSPTLADFVNVLTASAAISELTGLSYAEAEKAIKPPTAPTGADSKKEDERPVIETLEDCERITEELNNDLMSVIVTSGDIGWFDSSESLRKLRLVFLEQMRNTAALLPGAKQITLYGTEPALVVLYRETGSSKEHQRFIRRNGIKNPSFVAGGRVMEIISNE